jgi:hypothetical protein
LLVLPLLCALALAADGGAAPAAPLDGGAPKGAAAPAPKGLRLIILPSAASPAAGQPSAGPWARGIGTLLARELASLKGGDDRVFSVVQLGVKESSLGFLTPDSPVSLREAVAVGRFYRAELVAELHVDQQKGKLFLDVIDVAGRESRFAHTYDWKVALEPPPMAKLQRDLGHASGIAVRDAELAGAAWAQTRSHAALEAFVGGLDSLVLHASQRGRTLGATRPPAQLFAEALQADGNFAEARRLADLGLGSKFLKVIVREVSLDAKAAGAPKPGKRKPKPPPEVPKLKR